MKLLITERQLKTLFDDMSEYLNNYFSDRYEICKFEVEHSESNPILRLKLDNKWVKQHMSESGFTKKNEIKEIVNKAKSLIIDRYNDYIEINVYSGKC
jgi:hypothetical protein